MKTAPSGVLCGNIYIYNYIIIINIIIFFLCFPTSLCGVLVFGCALPPPPSASARRPPPPARRPPTHHIQLVNTQLTHAQLDHTTWPQTTCSHAACPHTTYSHTTYSHTTWPHTTCSHTTWPHATCSHNLLTHNLTTGILLTQLTHTQLDHTQLGYTPNGRFIGQRDKPSNLEIPYFQTNPSSACSGLFSFAFLVAFSHGFTFHPCIPLEFSILAPLWKSSPRSDSRLSYCPWRCTNICTLMYIYIYIHNI